MSADPQRQMGAGRGRTRRHWAVASLVAALGVVVAATACADRERAATTTKVQAATGPAPSSSDQPVTGIWPFASRQEADAYAAGKDQTYRDPVRTAQEFSVRYVGMKDPVVFEFRDIGSGAGEVGVGSRFGEDGRLLDRPEPTTFVEVRQLSTPGVAWTVTGARTSSIVAQSPRPQDSVASPVTVEGRADVFGARVWAEVKEHGMTADRSLGRGSLRVSRSSDGQPGPFGGRVAFAPPSKPGGAVIFSERSAVEGQGVLRASVVPIRFEPRSSTAKGDAPNAPSASAKARPGTAPTTPPRVGPPRILAVTTQPPLAEEDGWWILPPGGGRGVVHVRAVNTERVRFFLAPTGTGITEDMYTLLGEDTDGRNGWTLTWNYPEGSMLGHLIVQAISETGKAEHTVGVHRPDPVEPRQ